MHITTFGELLKRISKGSPFQLNIPDDKTKSGVIITFDIEIEARDKESGSDYARMDCAAGSGRDQKIAEFQYCPATGLLSGEVTGPANDWDNTYTEGDHIKVWFTITKTYAEKIHTYLVASDDIYYDAGENHEDEQRMVYTGEDQFYVFFVDQTTPTNFYYRYYAFIVPKSIYFGSKFYVKTMEENLSHLNLGVNNDDKFITRDFDSIFAPRSVEGIFKLKGENGSPIWIDNLKFALTHNETDVSIANLTLLTSSDYDDSHSYQNFIHTIGLPSDILGIIPNAPKRLESPVKHYKDNAGWYDSLTGIRDEAWKCVATAAEYLKDFVTMIADIGFKLVHEMIEAAAEIAEAVVDAFNALYRWIVEKITSVFESIIEKVTSWVSGYINEIENTMDNFFKELTWFENENFTNATETQKDEHVEAVEIAGVAFALSFIGMQDKADELTGTMKWIMELIEPFSAVINPMIAIEQLTKTITSNIPSIPDPFDLLYEWLTQGISSATEGLLNLLDDVVGDVEIDFKMPVTKTAMNNLIEYNFDESGSFIDSCVLGVWSGIDSFIENDTVNKILGVTGLLITIVAVAIAVSGLGTGTSDLDMVGIGVGAFGLVCEAAVFLAGYEEDWAYILGGVLGCTGGILFIAGQIQQSFVPDHWFDYPIEITDLFIDWLLYASHFY